jgi:4-hydroxy-tetrahydrodipicolinate synthase
LRLAGVIPPVVLALDAAEEIDETGLRREVDHLLAAGVHGLLANGTTGEGVLLSPDEFRQVCEIVVEQTAARVPVVAGVVADSTRQALALGRLARAAGASALLVAPVHFVHVPTRAGLIDFFRAVGAEVGLPVVLYNVVEAVGLTTDVCLELAELPEVVAIKQSNDDFHQLADLLHLLGGRLALLAGIEDLLYPALALGAAGFMAAIAAVLPRQCVELYLAVQRGDFAAAHRLHRRLLPVVRAMLTDENFPATVKVALRLLGRPVGPPRRPLTPPSAAVEETIRRALEEAQAFPGD